MSTFATNSPDQTKQFAAALAVVCRPGDVVLLVGDLGAGKTTFVKGFAAGLGLIDSVTSPTFTLVQEYKNDRITLLHADVYRLADDDVADLVLAELVDGYAVTIVEWGERAAGALGHSYCEVTLKQPDEVLATDEDANGVVAEPRSIDVRFVGTDWVERGDLVTKTLSRWLIGGSA